MSLNKEQIQEVIDWLNKWSQLKNGVVPIRFKEDFEKQLVIPVSCQEFKEKNTPTFDEFREEFGIEMDEDGEYFFDDEYFCAMGLYYKYTEKYKVKP